MCRRFFISWLGFYHYFVVLYLIAVHFRNIYIPNYKVIYYITLLCHPFIWLWSSSFKFFASRNACNTNLSLKHWYSSWVVLLDGYMCIQQLNTVILEFMMISKWIVFIILEIRQFPWPYQNNLVSQQYYLPWYTNVNKYVILWTLSIYKFRWSVPHFGRDWCPSLLNVVLTLVWCFTLLLKHIGLLFSLKSCIETVIGHDIWNCCPTKQNCS